MITTITQLAGSELAGAVEFVVRFVWSIRGRVVGRFHTFCVFSLGVSVCGPALSYVIVLK